MAIQLMGLPQLRIQEQGLDAAPLTRAIQGYTAGNDAATQFANTKAVGQTAATGDLKAAARQAMGLGETDLGMQYQKSAQQEEQLLRKRLGSMAQAVEMEADPNRRQAMWQRVLKMVPGGATNLAPEEMDPMTGPKMLMAEAGIVVDPLERQQKQGAIGLQGLQSQSARLDIESKRRDLDSPKGVLTELDQNKTLMYTDPRTGQTKVLREPAPGMRQGPETTLDKELAKTRVDMAEKDIKAGYGGQAVLGSTQKLRDLAKNPGLESAIGPWQGSPWYQTIVGMLPLSETLGAASPSLNRDIGQIKSAIVLSANEKMKGLGPLSDADARRVEESVGLLERARTRTEFLSALAEIDRSVEGIMSRAGSAAQEFPQLGRGFQPAQQRAAQPQSGPQPGMVEDGYRFRGGNPADPNNWEPAR